MKKIILIAVIVLTATSAFAGDFFGVQFGSTPRKEMGKAVESRNGVDTYLIDDKDRMFCDTIVSSPMFYYRNNRLFQGSFYFQHKERYEGVLRCLNSKYAKSGKDTWKAGDVTIRLRWSPESLGIGGGDVTFTTRQ